MADGTPFCDSNATLESLTNNFDHVAKESDTLTGVAAPGYDDVTGRAAAMLDPGHAPHVDGEDALSRAAAMMTGPVNDTYKTEKESQNDSEKKTVKISTENTDSLCTESEKVAPAKRRVRISEPTEPDRSPDDDEAAPTDGKAISSKLAREVDAGRKESSEEPEPDWNKLRHRRPTYTTIKNSPLLSPCSAGSQLVKLPSVIVMVGLPARGKSYISSKLCRYLNWIGIRTKVFNVGNYRRVEHTSVNYEFFDPNNVDGYTVRRQCAQLALQDVCNYLDKKSDGEVAIFDATNSTRERRELLLESCMKHSFRVFFVESICEDPQVVETNIQDVKVNSPDYRNMDKELAREDFIKRIDQYRAQYDPLDEVFDNALSFIQVFNAGRSFFVNNIQGHVQSRVVYFLMNIHLMPRSIYLSRHGESEFNRMGRIGGDAPLSDRGLRYAVELEKFFLKEQVKDLRVWTSRKIRTVQTAQHVKNISSYIEHWKALDEIDAGICEGLTYEEIQDRYPEQFAVRDKDKYHYRYPSGESYEDLVARLEPVIMELERQENVLVISHQAVLRCLLAYFLDKTPDQLPYLRVPLHSVIKLTPVAYGCNMEVVKFSVDAVDTHRDKPSVVGPHRSSTEALSTVPPYPLTAKRLQAGATELEGRGPS